MLRLSSYAFLTDVEDESIIEDGQSRREFFT